MTPDFRRFGSYETPPKCGLISLFGFAGSGVLRMGVRMTTAITEIEFVLVCSLVAAVLSSLFGSQIAFQSRL
jgi:hypothetical protein